MAVGKDRLQFPAHSRGAMIVPGGGIPWIWFWPGTATVENRIDCIEQLAAIHGICKPGRFANLQVRRDLQLQPQRHPPRTAARYRPVYPCA